MPMTSEMIHRDLRCWHCDYNLRGLVGSKCPECGNTFDRSELIARHDSASRREFAVRLLKRHIMIACVILVSGVVLSCASRIFWMTAVASPGSQYIYTNGNDIWYLTCCQIVPVSAYAIATGVHILHLRGVLVRERVSDDGVALCIGATLVGALLLLVLLLITNLVMRFD